MYTNIILDDGVLQMHLVIGEHPVSQRRWRATIAPAVHVLYALGGGTLCVPHLPEDIAP